MRDLKERCDAMYMFKLMKWTSQNEYGTPLIMNDQNKHFMAALCYFLSEDPRFETELGYDLNKGLLIRGISGLGKTHLVKCLQDNELNPVLILSMVEITETIRDTGEFQINLGGRKVVYLDDVGTEEATVNHFGSKISFFKNFVELVYLKNKVFNKLMISTNNSFQQIEEKYGFRVRSRMKDMFNVIDVKGEDMRGK
jgi:DNA replication protein DnaC